MGVIMYKILTLVKYQLWKYPLIRVKELGIWNGWLCWKGTKKAFPEITNMLDKGLKVKVIVILKGVE